MKPAKRIPVVCPKCQGSGRVKSLRDGSISRCRKCKGTGEVWKKLKGW